MSMAGNNSITIIIGLILCYWDSGYDSVTKLGVELTGARYGWAIVIGGCQFLGLTFIAMAI